MPEKKKRSWFERLRNWGFRAPDVSRDVHRTDEEIEVDVQRALTRLSGVDVSGLRIRVEDADVHVSGYVEDGWARREVVYAFEAIKGVQEVVTDDLALGSPPDDEEDDAAPTA